MTWRKILFFLLIAFCLTPFALPPAVFAAGLIFALIFGNPYPNQTKKYGTVLFQISVVFCGFGLSPLDIFNSIKLLHILIIFTVVSPLLIGFLIIILFKIKGKTFPLIFAAIAVGGENAVSAIVPAINIEENESNAAISTIFLINLAAIFIFPSAGYLLNLSVNQYAVWTGLAIPGTLFVLNGATIFGLISLLIASAYNIIKLLFLIPVTYIFAYFYKENTFKKPVIPWVLFCFFISIVVRYYLPGFIPPSFYESLLNLAKAGLTITIFLTGIGFSRQTFKDSGIKPLIFGFFLWSLLAVISLIAVTRLVQF